MSSLYKRGHFAHKNSLKRVLRKQRPFYLKSLPATSKKLRPKNTNTEVFFLVATYPTKSLKIIRRFILRQLRFRYSLNSISPKRPELQKNSVFYGPFLRSERGSATLMGVMTMTFLCSYLFYQLLFSTHSLEVMRERSRTYICYRQVSTYFKFYVEIMAGANLAIDAAIASAVLTLGALSPEAANIVRNAMKLQDATHVWLVQKLTFSRYCSVTQKTFIFKSMPYQTSALLKLKRPFGVNVVTKRNQWTLNLPPSPTRIARDIENALAIKINFKLAGFYDPFLSYQARETSAGQLLNLNSHSGWSLSF